MKILYTLHISIVLSGSSIMYCKQSVMNKLLYSDESTVMYCSQCAMYKQLNADENTVHTTYQHCIQWNYYHVLNTICNVQTKVFRRKYCHVLFTMSNVQTTIQYILVQLEVLSCILRTVRIVLNYCMHYCHVLYTLCIVQTTIFSWHGIVSGCKLPGNCQQRIYFNLFWPLLLLWCTGCRYFH